MKLSSYFVREEQRWKKAALFQKFCLDEERGEQLLSLLFQYGVLQPVKYGDGEAGFKFSFVGVIFFQNLIIRCFPKYIRSTDAPRKPFAQVLNVLRRSGRESNAEYHPGGESGRMGFNLISAALSLLEDYAGHGLYSNTVYDSEYNGGGEILWDRTLSAIEPFYSKDGPLFLDFHTQKTVDDTSDYVTRLHRLILTECSQLLEESDLLSVFGFSPLRLSDEPREHFGPDDYILQRLRAELDIQFDCHKQELLRQLIGFTERKECWVSQPLRLYGTTNFEIVWENVCARVFGNQLKCALGKLLPSGLKDGYLPGTTLMQLIRKPQWHFAGGAVQGGEATLRPDIAVLRHSGDAPDFLILDAKYYCFSPAPESLPGIGDINKQYLYELAFRQFLNDHGIHRVQNIFLLPTEGDTPEYKGHVEVRMLKELGLENIKIVLLPAEKVFSAYLNETPKHALAEILPREMPG